MATTFSTLDADGQEIPLYPGRAFQTFWRRDNAGDYQPEEVSHPWTALDLYDADTLELFRITTAEVADPPRQVAKETITARVEALGKTADAMAYLLAHPSLFARWVVGDTCEADEPGLIETLTAIGCTADQIAAITAG